MRGPSTNSRTLDHDRMTSGSPVDRGPDRQVAEALLGLVASLFGASGTEQEPADEGGPEASEAPQHHEFGNTGGDDQEPHGVAAAGRCDLGAESVAAELPHDRCQHPSAVERCAGQKVEDPQEQVDAAEPEQHDGVDIGDPGFDEAVARREPRAADQQAGRRPGGRDAGTRPRDPPPRTGTARRRRTATASPLRRSGRCDGPRSSGPTRGRGANRGRAAHRADRSTSRWLR